MKAKAKIKPLFTFTVDRSKWRSGHVEASDYNQASGYGKTRLLNDEGYQCCLGFACSALKIPKRELFDVTFPCIVFSHLNKKLTKRDLALVKAGEVGDVGFDDSEFTNKAVAINDDMNKTRKQREAALEQLGREYKIEIKFKGKYESPRSL